MIHFSRAARAAACLGLAGWTAAAAAQEAPPLPPQETFLTVSNETFSAAEPGLQPVQGPGGAATAWNPADGPAPFDFSTREHLQSMHRARTRGAFDMVGRPQDYTHPPEGRPEYPYNNTDYWLPHDADVESWSHLCELPNVQLGWFTNVEMMVVSADVRSRFDSAGLLDGAFPGSPVQIGFAPLGVSVSPRIELGYRNERGLGEIKFGYQYFGLDGSTNYAGFDGSPDSRLTSSVRTHFFDLDSAMFEFNAQGLPFFRHPLWMWPGRWGLGAPLEQGHAEPPLEMRIVWGARGANYYLESEAVGPNTTDRVVNNFWGGGLHVAWDLNQRLAANSPYNWHFKLDGSGVWGTNNQTYSRTQGGNTASGRLYSQWIGIPSVAAEMGLGYTPDVCNRNMRFTAIYRYEQWFSVGSTDNANADVSFNAIMLRGEYKY